MATPKNRIRRRIIGIGAILLILLVSIFYSLFSAGTLQKRQDLNRLSSEDYQGVFFSMYDIGAYSEEDFVTYCGISVVKSDYHLQTWRDISKYLTEILSSSNSITNIYLGLDPMSLWESSNKDKEIWANNLERYLFPYFTARQDVEYEILLPIPSLQYWTKLDAAQLTERMEAYRELVEAMSSYSNVTTYFPGNEEWLIANPANYLENGQVNKDVSQKLFLYTFCDHHFQISLENVSETLEGLTSLIEQERQMPYTYPDLSNLCMVFFGDSVLVYNKGSMSLPGVIGGLSGAQVYNCGLGGMPASGNPAEFYNMNGMVNHFINQDIDGLAENDYLRGLMAYMDGDHQAKRHCFVLNFGLNDYFSGHPVENPEDNYDTGTYAGALRTGICALRENYPDALILVMTPTYTTLFSNGTEINSEVGSVLTEYVDAAVRVSEEMGVYCKNNYWDSGINAESQELYLADGAHPNEGGSLYLGRQIVEYIGSLASEEKTMQP